jgi:REP element-mobilizing transposase RayT
MIVDPSSYANYALRMSEQLPDRNHLKRIPVWIPSDQRVIYFVTASCEHRRKVFTHAQAVMIALESLIKCAATAEWNVPQICFMPDHVHVMLLPMREREQKLSLLMQRWKSSKNNASIAPESKAAFGNVSFSIACCDPMKASPTNGAMWK